MTFDINFKPELNLEAAIEQVDPVPLERCRTCQRWGLPILPLRAAYAPEPWQTQALPVSRDSEVTAVRMVPDQPRILRRGFLYVLLDRKHWQAYQITPEGALRQFPALQVPREEPVPLSTLCVQQDHDIPAAFLNINTHRYSTAWLAIANDPWPEAVLHAYQRGGVVDGMNLHDRFYKLDLKTARDDPASVGIAMTENDLQMHRVLEYAQPIAGDFRSVHGFYPRNHRLRALAGHVRTVTQDYQLPKGVLALVLPDPIGVVQELNAQRMLRSQAMQEWRTEPQRSFELLTSEALLGIREVQLKRAEERGAGEGEAEVNNRNKWNDSVLGVRTPLPYLDLEEQKQRSIAKEQNDARERLADRYDEQARATFEAEYRQTLAAWQRLIDEVAEPYVSHHDGAAFRLAGLHDYSVTSQESVRALILLTRSCHAGGVTDRHTEEFWKRELEHLPGLYYRAITGMDKDWLEQLGEDLTEGEKTRSYHAIKTLITTEKGKELMTTPIQAAIGDLLAAGATASYALGERLSAPARALIGRLHQQALLRYSGVQVTQLSISLKVGEYLTLLNEVLYEGTERVLAQLDERFRKPAARKVRAMLLKGQFTPALASGHSKLIEIKVWTLESADDLRARLDKLGTQVGEGIEDVMRYVRIDPAGLKDAMADYSRHINAEAARLLVRDGIRSLHKVGRDTGSGKLPAGLAMGSLYFQVKALLTSHENMRKTLGDGHDEAVAAVMSASVGVIGAGVETIGGAIQIARPNWTVAMAQAAGGVQEIGVGIRTMQYGGALVSLASAVEAVQLGVAAVRTWRTGDQAASKEYVKATIAAAGSAWAGVVGSLAPASLALFPLGVAVVLALATYGFYVRAKKLESDPLELWARHSRWGVPEKYRRWVTFEDMDTAIGVLNAALLRVTADAAINVNAEGAGGIPLGDAVPAGLFLKYRIVLPGYVVDSSRYEWSLQVYRPRQASGEIIASGRSDGTNGPLPPPASWKNPGYLPETTAPIIRHKAESGSLEIEGSISFFGYLEVHALQLEVSFWPDKGDEAGVARLIVREDKISGVRGEAFHEKS